MLDYGQHHPRMNCGLTEENPFKWVKNQISQRSFGIAFNHFGGQKAILKKETFLLMYAIVLLPQIKRGDNFALPTDLREVTIKFFSV